MTAPRLDFSRVRFPARDTDPDTSKAAASAALASETQRTLAGRILRAFRHSGPCTSWDVATRMGLTYQEVSRRVSDLRDLGHIRDTGDRVTGPHGRKVIVWEVTP